MSRKRRSTSTADNPSATDSRAEIPSTRDLGRATGPWLTFCVAVLLAARFFLPAESAALGETLWIVQFWLIAAVFWLWMHARDQQPLRPWDWLDVGLALLVGGHVVSALLVLFTEGDRRAALNMLWEWVGIGVSALMIREVVSHMSGSARLRDVVVISTIALSGLGLWQHHVWYPSLSEQLTEYDRLTTTGVADATDAARLGELQQLLGPLVETNDPASRQLMRARVLASTEPIGRFALANTFAGLLLVGLLLGVDALVQHYRRVGPSPLLWAGVVLLLAGAYCFWLTKSRTSVVGLIAGLTMWSVLSRRRRPRGVGVRRAVIGGIIVLVTLPIIASLSGGLDREVITEAPKSLQYRLEYWTATGEVIRESPVFGTGGGNFRQEYLQHKLPGSSEEILDPHNLFLDVWANGGLLALMGLLVVLATMFRAMWSPTTTPTENLRPASSGAVWRIGVGVAVLMITTFVELLNGSGGGMTQVWLFAGWAGVSLLWIRRAVGPPGTFCVAAAATALVVHLMGAGGIAMPAITQTLLLLSAWQVPTSRRSVVTSISESGDSPERTLPWLPMAGAATCLCLAIACAFTATLPVSAARTQIQLGRVQLMQDRNLPTAMRSFEAAAEADPLSSEPWQELAMAHLLDWQRTARTDDAAFERAVEAQRVAIELDPRSASNREMLGELWWRRYTVTRSPNAASESLSAFTVAAEQYPNHASLQARLAAAAAAAGDADRARDAAVRALKLDDANRSQGHSDKYLSPEARERSETLANPAAEGL